MSRAEVPFHRGVNLTQWFQSPTPYNIPFHKYDRETFAQIQSLGCDAIRLPVNLFSMTSGSPDYQINPLFLLMLDEVVGWAEELHIYLILDNHSTDEWGSRNPLLKEALLSVWQQLAERYKNRSQYLLYEVLNEPNGITTESWSSVQHEVVHRIREIDPARLLIVGASGYNSFRELTQLPVYDDPHLIYTFHFYEPFLFTHQGASWVNPPMTLLKNIPFPYSATLPPLQDAYKNTWIETSYNSYYKDGTADHICKLIRETARWAKEHHVALYCGEFGALMNNCDNNDRVLWYNVVRKCLEDNGIAWTTWDYQHGFGLFESNSPERFVSDLNLDLIDTLGLDAPDQRIEIEGNR